MESLAIAQRLAKKSGSKATVCPISHKVIKSNCVKNSENEPRNGIGGGMKKPHFAAPTQNGVFIPPIATAFSDENLKRYFKRFLEERKLGKIFEFIECVDSYRETFPENPEKQTSRHRYVVEMLGTLPSNFLKTVSMVSKDMASVTKNSFDSCVCLILKSLNEREYQAFLDSELFSKWILKYHNISEI